ncbi:MAG TPA: hypothetical protein VMO26_23820 [Vicinamibacterales bacterium]|nr:hypothetical protein [Vicinamibacterales bacterium]
MSLILAIEPDHRQAEQLAHLIRGRLNADLLHARTTEGALTALAGIGDRVPDLVLVPSLLSAQEDAAIAGALRVIAAAANVRMLTIPMLADPEQPAEHRGVFAKLRARKTRTTPGGCDPAVFADQIAAYLAEGAAERRARQAETDLAADDLNEAAAERVAKQAAEPAAAPIAASSAALFVEPAVDETLEPILKSILAPVVIEQPTLPVATIDDHVPVVVDEEPRPLWLAALAAPFTKRNLETASARTPVGPAPEAVVFPEEALATLEELVAPAAMRGEERALAAEEIEPVASVEERAAMLAAEPLQVLARDETPVVMAIDEPPVVIVFDEAPVVVAIDAAPLVVLTDETPVIPQSASEPEAGSDYVPVVPRRRRKNARPAAPAPEETFDIDALLAPLLSEIAAKRKAPARIEKPTVVAVSEETPPPEAIPADEPELISLPPAATVVSPPPDEVFVPAVAEAIQPMPADDVAIAAVAADLPIAAAAVVDLPIAAVAAADLPIAAVDVPVAVVAAAGQPIAAVVGVEPDVDPMFFADNVHEGTTDPAPTDRPAWVQLIESLRQDIERLKADRQPEAAAPAPPAADRAPRVNRTMSILVTPPGSTPEPAATPLSKIRKVTPRAKSTKPIQDQWGLFDPEQCGFAALRAKLDEIARDEASA